MSNLTPEQQKALDELASLDQKYRQGKVEAHARHRRLANEEIHDLKLARDIAAARADALGVPKIRIAQDGLHTTHVQAARKAIASGEAVLTPVGSVEPVEKGDEPTERYVDKNLSRNPDGTIAVRLDPVDFHAFGIEEEGARAFSFTVSADGNVQPVEPDDDETWLNPVVRVVTGANDEWRRRVVEFARGNG